MSQPNSHATDGISDVIEKDTSEPLPELSLVEEKPVKGVVHLKSDGGEAMSQPNSHATDGISDVIEKDTREPLPKLSLVEEKPVFTLDDLATESDDVPINGENPLRYTEVRKPGNQEFWMSHPKWQLSQRVVIVKSGFKDVVYLIHKDLLPPSKSLEQDSVLARLTVCINLKGRLFIWVIKKSKKDGDPSKYYRDANESIRQGRTKWVRHFWLADEARHDRRIAELADVPAWPQNITLQDVLVAGFGDRIILTENDPILRQLRGEISDD